MKQRSVKEVVENLNRFIVTNVHLLSESRIENSITIDVSPSGKPEITWERRHNLKGRVDDNLIALSLNDYDLVVKKALSQVEILLIELMETPRVSGRVHLTFWGDNIEVYSQ
ncbi:hypothetical protein PV433_10875 [Paenibacillus sp. GYB004]|uniref:hypothetical protein n=1 Tax=Paenibacillus sp. GYB004 TaxID=2994393 RepID=UPI002F964936